MCSQDTRQCQKASHPREICIQKFGESFLWNYDLPDFKLLTTLPFISLWSGLKMSKTHLYVQIFKMKSQESCPTDTGSVNIILTGYRSGKSLHQHLELVHAWSFNINFLTFQLFFSSFHYPLLNFSPWHFQVSLPFLCCSHAPFLSGHVIFVHFKAVRDFSDHPIQLSASSTETHRLLGFND